MLRKSGIQGSFEGVKAVDLKVGIPAVVTGLILDVMSGRIMSLGIRKGAKIQKLRRTTGDGILFKVEDHSVVIHRSLANLIEVTEDK